MSITREDIMAFTQWQDGESYYSPEDDYTPRIKGYAKDAPKSVPKGTSVEAVGFDPYDDAPVVEDAYKQDFSEKRRSKPYVQGPLEEMAVECHTASYNNGWWHDPDTGKELPTTGFLGAHVIGCKIGLIGSEVSEIVEGHRKQKMDDKLPQYRAMDVEIVDVLIRLLDLAGKQKTPLTEIYKEKMKFNDVRPDHQLEQRKAGGKLY